MTTTIRSTSVAASNAPQKVHVAKTMFLVLLFVGFLIPLALWFWFHFSPNVVLAATDVGQFVSASKDNGATDVETTKGTVSIDGTLSALRGSELVVQRSTKTGTELCVAGSRESCVALSGPWPGPLQPVSGTRHAMNFFAVGISQNSLHIWLMFGSLVTLASTLAAAVESGDNDR